ncbi:MAG: hypothetical protein ACRDGV_01970 [Candidatus Limnocylindria bacterium]
MVIAALLIFVLLLVAWLLAPTDVAARQERALPSDAEPMPIPEAA